MRLLALLLVPLALPSLASGHVVAFDQGCPEFFIPKPEVQNAHIFPTILLQGDQNNRYRQICQFYKNHYRFATLYDTTNRIPVYSAYTVALPLRSKKNKLKEWKIEPQLEDEQWEKQMVRAKKGFHSQHQAVDDDYTNDTEERRKNNLPDIYTRGHLNPKRAADSKEGREATFTLTNAAPQLSNANQEWVKVEDLVFKNEQLGIKQCSEMAYLVTGVVPGDSWLGEEGENEKRVNVPQGFWTAYCCKKKNQIDKYISKAYRANKEDDFKMLPMSVGDLEKWLSEEFKSDFRVFGRIKGCGGQDQ